MIDDIMDETVDSLSDLGIDAEDIGLDQDDLGQIFALELGVPEVFSEDEFENVVRAIARSRSDLDDISASIAEIDDYVDGFENVPERLSGLLSNIKGIYGELEVRDQLNESNDGIFYCLALDTSNPDVDIYGYDAEGNVVQQIQVKMTEDPEYIRTTLQDLPEGVQLISGVEMAVEFPGQVLDVGLSAYEIGEDARAAIEILSTQEPEFDDLPASVPFAEYIRAKGIAFV